MAHVARLSEIGEQLAYRILDVVFAMKNEDPEHGDEVWDQWELYAEMTAVAAMTRDCRTELVTLPEEQNNVIKFD